MTKIRHVTDWAIIAQREGTDKTIGHAKKVIGGWIITSKIGPLWPSIRFQAKPGEKTPYKHVKTKAQAVKILKSLEA